MQKPNSPMVVCGMSKQCTVKKCIHKSKHLHSDACKGLCRNMGYPDCFVLKENKRA